MKTSQGNMSHKNYILWFSLCHFYTSLARGKVCKGWGGNNYVKNWYRRDCAIISSYYWGQECEGHHTSITMIVFNLTVHSGDERIIRKRIIRKTGFWWCIYAVSIARICRQFFRSCMGLHMFTYIVRMFVLKCEKVGCNAALLWIILWYFSGFFIRLLSSLKWFDSWYDCLSCYNRFWGGGRL